MSRRRVTNPRVDRPADSEHVGPRHLYRLFAADGTLLYIGVTEDVAHRVYMHRQTTVCTGWLTIWTRYHHHTADQYPDMLSARAAEKSAIFAEAPLLNRQHNPKRWTRVGGKYVPTNAADHVIPLPPRDPRWDVLLERKSA